MDKKTVFLAVITGLAFVVWMNVGPILEQKLGLTPPPQDVPENTIADNDDGSNEKSGEAKSLDDAPDNDSEETPKETDVKEVEKPVEEVVKLLPKETLEQKDVVMTVDPQNGIDQVSILSHKQTMKDNSPNIVIGDDKFSSLYLTGVADNWEYGTAVVKKTADSISITRPVKGKNLLVEQVIKLDNDYQFKSTFKFKNTGAEAISIENLGVNAGQMSPIQIGDAVGMMAGMDQGIDVYYKNDEEIETHFFQDVLERAQEIETEQGLQPGQGKYFLDSVEGGFQWISVKNRYFAWIVDYESGFKSCQVSYNQKDIIHNGQPEKVNYVTAVGYLGAFKVQPGTTYEVELNCFAGPQELGILNKMDHNKKGVMQLNLFMFYKVGWIGFISELMLKALLWFYSFIGSYGLSIIMLTIIVKALFWRMTNKSTESMKKMSTLSPKIKELNEKYKDNPQVKQQKIMELYREAGVNPVAGCLPLFLQMPVFIALFNALRGAIELRHSEFLWIADLSQPDTIFEIAGLPVRPLAIAWAVSMFLQQKIVPSTADETQKKIMMFMPVVMLFICYGMPSGLTLYWTFSTFMSILQYYLNNKKASANETQTAAKAATG